MIGNNTENNLSKDAENDAKWYVIHTYSGYENKVATDIEKVVENRKLDNLIKEIRVPIEKVVEVKDNKKKEVEKKIYPGYVLLKMILTDDSWYVVRNTRGVTGFVGPGSKPVPLTEKEVLALGIGSEKVTIDIDLNKGDRVEIKSGSLSGYVGEVSDITLETGVAIVSVFMFGRKMNIDVDINQLKKVD